MTDPQFDLEYYALYRSKIADWFRTKDVSTPERQEYAISEFAACTGCAVIAAFCFYMEAFGETPRLRRCLESLLRHYRFSGIKPK